MEMVKPQTRPIFASVNTRLIHTCGVRADGSVQCWGLNHSGETGAPAGSFDSISAGAHHTCGLKTDGSLKCWGSNEDFHGNEVGQATPPDGVTTTETSTTIYGVHGNLNAKCEEIQAFVIDLRGQTGAEQTWQIIVAPTVRPRTWPYPVDTYAVDLKVLSSSQVAGARMPLRSWFASQPTQTSMLGIRMTTRCCTPRSGRIRARPCGFSWMRKQTSTRGGPMESLFSTWRGGGDTRRSSRF